MTEPNCTQLNRGLVSGNNPCEDIIFDNGGTCIAQGDGAKCLCKDGFSGESCQNGIYSYLTSFSRLISEGEKETMRIQVS